MSVTSPETTVSKAKKNSFRSSLVKGFTLSNDQLNRGVEAMRGASVYTRLEVIIPARKKMPNTKDMSPEEKRATRAEVNASDAARIEDVRAFLAGFLPPDIALMLSGHLKPNVEGLVALTAPGDEHFTLIVE